MAARQQSKEQERGSTKKSVLDALRSLKAKKQEQPAQEQDKPKKAKSERNGIMMNVRFDELELMLVAMFEQKALKGTIQTLTEVQQLVAEDAEMAVLVQQSIQKLQQLNEQQFKGLELEWYKPDEPNQKVERVADEINRSEFSKSRRFIISKGQNLMHSR